MPSNKRRPKDDEVSVTSEGNKPLKNVPALMGEGEKFFRDKLYDKAIQCYSEASGSFKYQSKMKTVLN